MRLAVYICLTVGCLQGAVAGEIYCNAQGRDCSDRPSPTRSFIRTSSVAGIGGGVAAPAPGNTVAAVDPVQQQRSTNATLAKAQAELKKDLTDKRSEQCKSAQTYYKSAVDATVIYRTGKDGKREDLSEKDAAAARLSAKLNMDRSCAAASAN
jgi:hypothetical protein